MTDKGNYLICANNRFFYLTPDGLLLDSSASSQLWKLARNGNPSENKAAWGPVLSKELPKLIRESALHYEAVLTEKLKTNKNIRQAITDIVKAETEFAEKKQELVFHFAPEPTPGKGKRNNNRNKKKAKKAGVVKEMTQPVEAAKVVAAAEPLAVVSITAAEVENLPAIKHVVDGGEKYNMLVIPAAKKGDVLVACTINNYEYHFSITTKGRFNDFVSMEAFEMLDPENITSLPGLRKVALANVQKLERELNVEQRQKVA